MSAASGLRRAHFFKKVPREITEASWLGGVVSLTGVVVTLLLSLSLTRQYRTVSVKTELVLDKGTDQSVDLFFNITMERLPCRFTSIDVFDETGTKRLNISTSITKERVSSFDGHILGQEEAEEWTDEPDVGAGDMGAWVAGRQLTEGADSGPGDVVPLLTGSTSGAAEARAAAPDCVDSSPDCAAWAKAGECDKNVVFMHKSCKMACGVCKEAESVPDSAPEPPPAGTLDFEEYIGGKELAMVAFGAPWCPWSQRLSPVWEEVHSLVRLESLLSQIVGIARVDCTQKASRALCSAQQVHAFPTIRIYRAHNRESHEEYAGARTAADMLLFLHEAVEMHELELGWHPLTRLTHVSGEGCRISGQLSVSRVPGSLRVSAQSQLHSFDPLNMNVTHHVDALLFLTPGADPTQRLVVSDALAYWKRSGAKRRAATANDAVLDAMVGAGGMGEAQLRKSTFTMHMQETARPQRRSKSGAAAVATTLKHYLKVVPTRNLLLDGGALDSFQYASNFAEFQPRAVTLALHSASEMFEPHALVPQTVFAYDISPLRVVHRQKARSFGDYVTQLCAVIGGVFTVFGLIDNVIHAGVKAVKQD